MLGLLRSWVLNIVSIVIFITFLEILLPNGSVKKYIKMIVGLLVMVVILSPLLDLVNGEVKIENEIFKTTSQLDQKSFALSIDQLETKQNQQMINQYKSKIENSIKERIEYENNTTVLHISSIIEEDKNSQSLGEIKELNIVIEKNSSENDDINDSNVIPTIQISIGNNSEKNKSSPKNLENEHLVNEIKNNISHIYALDKDKVKISVE